MYIKCEFVSPYNVYQITYLLIVFIYNRVSSIRIVSESFRLSFSHKNSSAGGIVVINITKTIKTNMIIRQTPIKNTYFRLTN